MTTFKAPPRWLTYALAAAAVFAIFPLPYGYYQFLRLIVTGYTGYLAWHYFQNDLKPWAWTYAFIAILYNPVFVISMSREFHSLVNLITAGIILWDMRDNRALFEADRTEDAKIVQSPLPANYTQSNRAKDPEKKSGIALRALITFCFLVFGVAATIVYIQYERKLEATADTEEYLEEEEQIGELNDSKIDEAAPDVGAIASSLDAPTQQNMSGTVDTIPIVSPSPEMETDAATSEDGEPLSWKGKEGLCHLSVSGKSYINGICWVKLETDGSFQIMSRDESYFAQLDRSGGEAVGHWNETSGSNSAQATLGAMTRSGACWNNEEAKICAWSR